MSLKRSESASHTHGSNRKNCLISGYIRETQALLANNIISDDIKHICASYIYWYRHQTNLYHGVEDDDTSANYSFLHPFIVTQQYILEQRHHTQTIDAIKQVMINRFTHLVNRGYLASSFRDKHARNPDEILRFVRHNRSVVHAQINKRLELRPSIRQLQQKNIIPYGAFLYNEYPSILPSISDQTGSDQRCDSDTDNNTQIRHHPFKFRETIVELETHLSAQPRPSLRALYLKGILNGEDMAKYFDIDMDEPKSTIDRKAYLIYGYIRETQALLANNIISDDIKHICASYVYWYHHQTNIYTYHGVDEDTATNHSFLHPFIVTQQYILEQRHHTQTIDEIKQIMINRFAHLVNRGFLAPHFYDKLRNPDEIHRFLRENRRMVCAQINKRLELRPSIPQLQQKHIIPYGAFVCNPFELGSDQSCDSDTENDTVDTQTQIRHHPFKFTETIMELETHWSAQPRPSLRVLHMKGIINASDMAKYFDVDMRELNSAMRKEIGYSDALIKHTNNTCNMDAKKYVMQFKNDMYEVLRATLHDALHQSCLNTNHEETQVLEHMAVMNEEMKNLRSSLDKYFLSDEPDVLQFQSDPPDEQVIRDSFHKIQQKLLQISTQQNAIQNKLKTLQRIEKNLPSMEQEFDVDLIKLRGYEQIINMDLYELSKLNETEDAFDDIDVYVAVSELKCLQQNIGNRLCELKIRDLQAMFGVHREIAIADATTSNAFTYHGACFVLIIWFGTEYPNELQHVMASFVASKNINCTLNDET
eukprot:372943_1